MNKVVMGRRMPGIMIFAIALVAIVFSAACSKNANTGNSTNSGNSANTTKSSTNSSTSSSTTGTGPTAALRAYYQAAMNKDMVTAKRYLSAGTMRVMEEGAKKMGKTLDDAFKEGANQTPTTAMPEFSNEKINGDTATVDLKVEGMTLTMPMVKEDGEWKLAMDKMIEDMKNAAGSSSAQPKAPTESQDDDDSDNHNSGH